MCNKRQPVSQDYVGSVKFANLTLHPLQRDQRRVIGHLAVTTEYYRRSSDLRDAEA